MNDIITNSNIQSSSADSKGLIKEQNTTKITEDSLRGESLQNDNQQATDSLVDRMINYQQDKVNPGVSVTKAGALDLNEDHKS